MRRNPMTAYALPGGTGPAQPAAGLFRPAPPSIVPASYCPGKTGGDRTCTPEEIQRAKADEDLIYALYEASRELIWYNQPSPLVEPPFRADVLDSTFARVVIAPPTAPGDADGATGAVEIAAAEAAISGQAVPVLTPATTTALVNVIAFTVPLGHALYVNSIGTWGHDFLASREVIQWRVTAAGKPIVTQRELGLQGSLDTPVRVHAILHENQQLLVQAVNRDARSPSLAEVIVFGWVFPVLRNDDTFRSLLDPQRGPKDQGRFAPGQGSESCS